MLGVWFFIVGAKDDSEGSPMESSFWLRPFRRKGNAKKKWRERAMLVDLSKTRIVFERSARPRHNPPWVHQKTEQSSVQEVES
jgi:hypothetical protein